MIEIRQRLSPNITAAGPTHNTGKIRMKFVGETFDGVEVTLDYNQFIDCTFRNCLIGFAGGQFQLSGRTTFDAVRFGVAEAAHRTITFLNLVRSMPNGEQQLQELMSGNAPSPPQSMKMN